MLAALVVFVTLSRPQPGPNVGVASTAQTLSPIETDDASLPDPTSETVANSAEPTTPITQLPELERSIMFWDAITGGEHPEDFGPLPQAVSDADLIILGRFTAMRFGEMVSGFGVTRSTITIDEVISGVPQTPTPGSITLQGVRARNPELVVTLMPESQQLLFLHYVPWELEREGLPPDAQIEELYDYTVIGGTQGVILDIDGFARALDPRNPARFPGMLEGQSFEDVVEATREAAGTAANATFSVP
jgi:hypothetical protein